ncbi:MAG: DUF1553 domain-containing protein [Bryobacteraceae bacterium]|jgi:hypothetical protein
MRSFLLFIPFLAAAAGTLPLDRVAPFEANGPITSHGRIDDLAFARWQQLGIEPSKPCSDEVFLRRVYLDVIGALPTPEEAARFLQDQDAAKRATLVDRLLERGEFADYWALKWSDLLRVKSEFPINLWPNAVQAYYRWIHTAVATNLPYDRWARQMLVSSGSNFRVPEVNFYRAIPSRDPQAIAQAVALTFMGARTSGWPKPRLDGMAAFFSQLGYKSTSEWKEEIVYFDFTRPTPSGAVFPDGRPARLTPGEDPRQVFANWLLEPANPWFARNIVNRIWYWLLGRGVVQESDDIRPDNPPANPELLACLERELASSHYDLRHIYRLILNSQVYQLSSLPRDTRPEAAANFASYPLRRLDAETLIDAISQITGAPEDYSSPIPEPFTYLPENQRSTTIPDGSIGSAFLDMFGRPPRDTGLASERNNAITTEQRLHLLNSSHIQLKIQQSTKLRTLVQAAGTPRAPIERLYLAILSRYPTAGEWQIVTPYFQAAKANRWQAVTDLAWALINSAEFLYRH